MSAASPTAVLDLEIISSIRALSSPETGDDLLKELVTLFSETTPPLLQSLRNAVSAKEFKVMQRVSHRLKGGSSNVGAMSMSRLCAEIERHAFASDGIDYQLLLDRLDGEYSRALEHLNAEVAKH